METNKIYTYRFDHAHYHKGSKAGVKDIVQVAVSPYWFAILKELDRLEYNDWHRENRRHVSYEKLELLDDYLVPNDLLSQGNNPSDLLIEKEITDEFFNLYDKILRGTKILTRKQHIAFELRALCGASFQFVAYHMRFACQMNENEQSAKKHFYSAIKKIREQYSEDYKKLQDFLENR